VKLEATQILGLGQIGRPAQETAKALTWRM